MGFLGNEKKLLELPVKQKKSPGTKICETVIKKCSVNNI